MLPFSFFNPLFNLFWIVQLFNLIKNASLVLHTDMVGDDFRVGCELAAALSTCNMLSDVFLELSITPK